MRSDLQYHKHDSAVNYVNNVIGQQDAESRTKRYLKYLITKTNITEVFTVYLMQMEFGNII